MISRYLLDTSALLAHSRGEQGCKRAQQLFDESEAEILIASLSLVEFARRLRELGATVTEARQMAIEYQQTVDEVVTVNGAVALTAFDIGCEATKRLPLIDALIAAAAREQRACLVHRDPHFLSIPAHLLQQLSLSGEV